jgi:phospholipase C
LEHPEWLAGWDWPTEWTLFEQAGMTSSYYFSNLPELAFWGPRHLTHCRHVSNYFADAALGTLPQVSFIDPFFVNEGLPGNDDHPHADIRLGQAFLSDVVEAFVSSPCYERSALVVTYDEWGGFWDHVPPPRITDDRATPNDPGGVDDFGQLGFRIPSSVVSPWTRGERVDHTVYEHTSIVRFITENWGLPYLTLRHRHTNSLESAFGGFRSFDPTHGFVPYRAPAHLLLEPTLEAAGLPLDSLLPAPARTLEQNDLFRLADTGWFDGLGLDLDHRLEDGFLHRSDIVDVLRTVARTPIL